MKAERDEKGRFIKWSKEENDKPKVKQSPKTEQPAKENGARDDEEEKNITVNLNFNVASIISLISFIAGFGLAVSFIMSLAGFISP